MVCLIFITLVLYTRHYDCTHLTSASCSLVFIYLPTCSPLPQLGTHENFSTRTADSRNEDATVDARSSRRRDRSMSLGSSISSDGEDDQGGPALNMSSPSHSSYYVSTNSYLDTSIYTKMGIPITLSESLPLLSPTISDQMMMVIMSVLTQLPSSVSLYSYPPLTLLLRSFRCSFVPSCIRHLNMPCGG